MQDFSKSVLSVQDPGAKLTVDQLAEALYEGTPLSQKERDRLRNLPRIEE